MGLLDEIRQQPTRKGPRCTVGLLLERIEPDDRKDLQAALDDVGIPAQHIVAALKPRGHVLGDHAIGRHRRSQCACL